MKRIGLIAVVIIIAGCVGGPGGTGTMNGTLTSASETPATDTPMQTSDPAATETASPSVQTEDNAVQYPPGYDEDGITSPEQAMSVHEEHLLNVSNYSATFQVIALYPNGSEHTNKTTNFAVNPASDEYLFYFIEQYPGEDNIGQHQEVYFSDGREQSYSLESEEIVADQQRNFSEMVFTVRRSLQPMLNDFALQHTSTTSQNGETILEYSITGLNETDSSNFNSGSGKIQVTNDGRIVNMTLAKSDEEHTQILKYSVSRIGDTAISRPAWVNSTKSD